MRPDRALSGYDLGTIAESKGVSGLRSSRSLNHTPFVKQTSLALFDVVWVLGLEDRGFRGRAGWWVLLGVSMVDPSTSGSSSR